MRSQSTLQRQLRCQKTKFGNRARTFKNDNGPGPPKKDNEPGLSKTVKIDNGPAPSKTDKGPGPTKIYHFF
jgi:hypothetical protein